MILVTGPTGHLGSSVVDMLLSQNEEVRLFVLPQERLRALHEWPLCDIESGDIRSEEDVSRAIAGCDTVLHVAGMVSISNGSAEWSKLKAVNVIGTRNVVNGCLAHSVKRMVYVSSIHAMVEPPKGTTIQEDLDFRPEMMNDAYSKSKSMASVEVQKGIARGLDAVMVFPSGMIGPKDTKPSQTGGIISHIAHKLEKTKKEPRRMFCFNGAYDFVDVRDVAKGVVLAMRIGRKAQGYILSGHKMSIPDIYHATARFKEKQIKLVMAPLLLVRLAAKICEDFCRLVRKAPLFTPVALDVLASNSNICSEKAKRELGYTKRPFEETIADTVSWFESGEIFAKGRKKLRWRMRQAVN
ncbi:MAG: NAD-dependent epimerase/dehydratase family protein [Christensenellales bacterium]